MIVLPPQKVISTSHLLKTQILKVVKSSTSTHDTDGTQVRYKMLQPATVSMSVTIIYYPAAVTVVLAVR